MSEQAMNLGITQDDLDKLLEHCPVCVQESVSALLEDDRFETEEERYQVLALAMCEYQCSEIPRAIRDERPVENIVPEYVELFFNAQEHRQKDLWREHHGVHDIYNAERYLFWQQGQNISTLQILHMQAV